MAALAVWFAVRAVETWRFQTELRQAQLDFNARRFGAARVRLVRLAHRRPGQGEVEYPARRMRDEQGPCAKPPWRLGAGSRTRPRRLRSRRCHAADSPSTPAAMGSRRPASTAPVRAGRRHRQSRPDGCSLTCHWITGRHDDYRSFLRREFEHTRDPAETLRLLWSLDHEPYPIEGMRETLEKARSMAPDDDRVWLALADLATRSGRFDEAGDWLTRCERARPSDDAVWRARLEWAQAAGRPDEVMRAASHLPASGLPRERLLELVAWLAARQRRSPGRARGPRRARRPRAG